MAGEISNIPPVNPYNNPYDPSNPIAQEGEKLSTQFAGAVLRQQQKDKVTFTQNVTARGGEKHETFVTQNFAQIDTVDVAIQSDALITEEIAAASGAEPQLIRDEEKPKDPKIGLKVNNDTRGQQSSDVQIISQSSVPVAFPVGTISPNQYGAAERGAYVNMQKGPVFTENIVSASSPNSEVSQIYYLWNQAQVSKDLGPSNETKVIYVSPAEGAVMAQESLDHKFVPDRLLAPTDHTGEAYQCFGSTTDHQLEQYYTTNVLAV